MISWLRIQARRFIKFIETYFEVTTASSGTKRLSDQESVKRGSIIQEVRNGLSPLDTPRTIEEMGSSSVPFITFAVNEFLNITLDFNFGAGNKEILFGLQFNFESGDEVGSSIQNMLRSFFNDTVADKGGSDLGGFSFTETASTLAGDLVNSLVIGVHVDVDVRFGLDLNNLFNETAVSRLPSPFLKLYTFDVEGMMGINEWSTSLEIQGFKVAITEARALFGIEAGITSGAPLLLKSAHDFLNAISPTNASGIGLTASLDVRMPIFVLFQGLGFGATLQYEDDNILDNVTQQPIFVPDVLISIEMIQQAASKLRNSTAFLKGYEPLQQKLPLLQVSVNQLIAGNERTLADMFDLTNFADNLVGAPTSSQPAATHEEYILLTELISQIRTAFLGLVKPDTNFKIVPAVPDVKTFNVTRPTGAICEGSDRAISIDIVRDGLSSLNLTICALLEFELNGKYDATGLLSAVEENFDVDLSGSFKLMGSLMFGAKMAVEKSGGVISIGINFDPISTELFVLSDLGARVSFGMVEARGQGQVNFVGQAALAYCPGCNGTHPQAIFRPVSNTSSFYFHRLFGFDVDSSIALSAGVPGVKIDTGLALSISDDDVFDANPPVIIPPDVQALRDLIKFSPANALAMLRLIDGEHRCPISCCAF